MARRFIEIVILLLLISGLSFAPLWFGQPDKMGKLRAGLADFWNKTGVLDFVIDTKHTFGHQHLPFVFKKELNGQEKLIYLKFLTDETYRCKLLVRTLNKQCAFTLSGRYWEEVISTTSANSDDNRIVAIHYAAKQLKQAADKFKIGMRGFVVNPKEALD